MAYTFYLFILVNAMLILAAPDRARREGGGGGSSGRDASGGTDGYTGSGGGTSGGTIGAIVGGVFGGLLLLCILCTLCIVCWELIPERCKGRPLGSNSSYINTGIAMQKDMSKYVFVPGVFETYYYHHDKYNGPNNVKLGFYPGGGYIVHGGGVDAVGTYTIIGKYSPRTLRMGLKKNYEQGTGDSSKNLGQTVTIQVEWNVQNRRFEGKYYVQTRNQRDKNIFIIRPIQRRRFRP